MSKSVIVNIFNIDFSAAKKNFFDRVFQSSELISASFQITHLNTLRGNAESSQSTSIKLVIPISPKAMWIDGKTDKFNFEKGAKTPSFELPAGKNLIESE